MKSVFIDRDGVLNIERPDFVKSWKEFEWIPGAREGLGLLKLHGWRLFVITNQSGINRGYMTEDDIRHIHMKMEQDLLHYNVVLDGIYYCPHRPDEHCSCRKPAAGLFARVFGQYDIEREQSWMIGDKITDLIPAMTYGLKTILIPSPLREIAANASNMHIVQPDLMKAAEFIIAQPKDVNGQRYFQIRKSLLRQNSS